MNKKAFLSKLINIICIVIMLMAVGFSLYSTNVSAARHPNLAAAQNLIERAIAKVSDAQVANEFDMKGHAAKSKELLRQAYDEIKLAAEAANK